MGSKGLQGRAQEFTHSLAQGVVRAPSQESYGKDQMNKMQEP